jgi:hypothetical protein
MEATLLLLALLLLLLLLAHGLALLLLLELVCALGGAVLLLHLEHAGLHGAPALQACPQLQHGLWKKAGSRRRMFLSGGVCSCKRE